jgi:hypothetical protein
MTRVLYSEKLSYVAEKQGNHLKRQYFVREVFKISKI